ncbi:hypothetical protein K1X76_11740 [bacterium]|nr:hypothetical protein [bacterium]
MRQFLFFIFIFISACTQSEHPFHSHYLTARLLVSRASSGGPTSFALIFNHPMVDDKTLYIKADPVFKVMPKLAGEGYWIDENTYYFEPNTQTSANRYTLVIPGGMRSRDGVVALTDQKLYLLPDSPHLINISPPAHDNLGPREALRLTWNSRPSLAELKAYIRVDVFSPEAGVNTKGWPIEVRTEGDNIVLVTPKTPYPARGEVTLYISKKLFRSDEEQIYKIAVAHPFILNPVSCLPVCDPTVPVTLHFSNPVSKTELMQYLRFDPPVEELSFTDVGGEKEWEVKGYFTPDAKYEIVIDKSLNDVHGQFYSGNTNIALAFKAVEYTLTYKPSFKKEFPNMPKKVFEGYANANALPFVVYLPETVDEKQVTKVEWGYPHKIEKFGETDNLSHESLMLPPPDARNKKLTLYLSPAPLMGDKAQDPGQSLAFGAMVQSNDRVLIESVFHSTTDRPLVWPLDPSELTGSDLYFRKNGEGKLYYGYMLEYDSPGPDTRNPDVAVSQSQSGTFMLGDAVTVRNVLVLKKDFSPVTVRELFARNMHVIPESARFTPCEQQEGCNIVFDKNEMSVSFTSLAAGVYEWTYSGTLDEAGYYPYAGLSLTSGDSVLYAPHWHEFEIKPVTSTNPDDVK